MKRRNFLKNAAPPILLSSVLNDNVFAFTEQPNYLQKPFFFVETSGNVYHYNEAQEKIQDLNYSILENHLGQKFSYDEETCLCFLNSEFSEKPTVGVLWKNKDDEQQEVNFQKRILSLLQKQENGNFNFNLLKNSFLGFLVWDSKSQKLNYLGNFNENTPVVSTEGQILNFSLGNTMCIDVGPPLRPQDKFTLMLVNFETNQLFFLGYQPEFGQMTALNLNSDSPFENRGGFQRIFQAGFLPSAPFQTSNSIFYIFSKDGFFIYQYFFSTELQTVSFSLLGCLEHQQKLSNHWIFQTLQNSKLEKGDRFLDIYNLKSQNFTYQEYLDRVF